MTAQLAADPMLPRPFRVIRAWKELADVSSVELAPVDGEALAFQPGQFNMLYAFGVGEVPISISGDPAEPERLIHTTRAVGATSTAISKLAAGDVLGVRGPFGTAWPVDEQRGREILFVAGGLGLAPLRPAICRVLHEREHYAGMNLVYGARSPEALLYPGELKTWGSRFDTEVEVTVDHAARGWTGRVGVVTNCLGRAMAGADPSTVSAFVCGPEIMMRFSIIGLMDAGVPADRIWISMERNMKCAIGFCGHCQFGAEFVCKDGAVFRYDRLQHIFGEKEV